VTSTKTGAFTPSTFTSTQNTNPNRVYFSKLDQPEAVPAVNFLTVGTERQPLDRGMPTRDALWLFQRGEGVFRLSGTGGEFRVDRIDASLSLAGPETLGVLNDRIYGLFTAGVRSVGDSGVEKLSDLPVWNEMQREIEFMLGTPNQRPVPWGTGNERTDEYWVSTNRIYADARQGFEHVWIYSVRNGQWTRADLIADAGVYDPDIRKIFLGAAQAYELPVETDDLGRDRVRLSVNTVGPPTNITGVF
jgi:hypothetical protein